MLERVKAFGAILFKELATKQNISSSLLESEDIFIRIRHSKQHKAFVSFKKPTRELHAFLLVL